MTDFAGTLVHLLWPWLAGAALLGAVAGAATCSRDGSGRGGVAALLAMGCALAAAGAAAVMGLVPGQAGLRLEIGLALAFLYVAGCGLGCLARRLAR